MAAIVLAAVALNPCAKELPIDFQMNSVSTGSLGRESDGIVIADQAMQSYGDYAWMPRDSRFLFGLRIMDPKYLCNFYVADTIEGAGLPRPVVGGRTPTASDWNNTTKIIPGWVIIHPTSETRGLSATQIMALRRPGDVISSGAHVGFVGFNKDTISAATVHRVNRSFIPIELESSFPTKDLDAYGSVQISQKWGWTSPAPGETAKRWEERGKEHLESFVVRRYVGGAAPEPSWSRRLRELKENFIYLSPQQPVAPYVPPRSKPAQVSPNQAARAARSTDASGCLVARSPKSSTILACDNTPDDAMSRFVGATDRLMPRDFWWRMAANRTEYLWVGDEARARATPVANVGSRVAESMREVYRERDTRRVRAEAQQAYRTEIRRSAEYEVRALERQRRIAAENAMRNEIASFTAPRSQGSRGSGQGSRSGSAISGGGSGCASKCPDAVWVFEYDLRNLRRD